MLEVSLLQFEKQTWILECCNTRIVESGAIWLEFAGYKGLNILSTMVLIRLFTIENLYGAAKLIKRLTSLG